MNAKLLFATVFLAPLLLSCGTKKTGMSGPTTDIFGNSGKNGKGSVDGLPGLGPIEKKALTNLNEELAETAPESGVPDFSKSVTDALNSIQQAEKKGQDTTKARYDVMAKMLSECANSVSKYAPSPGEPLMGQWNWVCPSTELFASSTWKVEGTYQSKDEAGIPQGNPQISYKGSLYGTQDGKTLTGSGKGTVSVDKSGKGEGNGDWVGYFDGETYPFKWKCPMTDQPSAASGTCSSEPNWEKCPTFNGKLSKSENPIPKKYEEGIKKLGACYRKAIVLTSPILWNYTSQLSPSTQDQLQQYLYLK